MNSKSNVEKGSIKPLLIFEKKKLDQVNLD